MIAQSLLSSIILKRVMTVFLFVLTQKRVMAPSNDNVLGLMRVMCGTRVTLLSFGTREYFCFKALSCAREFRSIMVLPTIPCCAAMPESFHFYWVEKSFLVHSELVLTLTLLDFLSYYCQAVPRLWYYDLVNKIDFPRLTL